MKIIRQIGIIFLVCWLSEVIERFLPFTFPASVIGMALLLACLLTGVLKIRHIQEKADFLLENMAFFFIPAGVSIINYFDVLKSSAVQLIIICVVSTVVTFAVTAWSVKLTVRCMALAGSGGTGRDSSSPSARNENVRLMDTPPLSWPGPDEYKTPGPVSRCPHPPGSRCRTY